VPSGLRSLVRLGAVVQPETGGVRAADRLVGGRRGVLPGDAHQRVPADLVARGLPAEPFAAGTPDPRHGRPRRTPPVSGCTTPESHEVTQAGIGTYLTAFAALAALARADSSC